MKTYVCILFLSLVFVQHISGWWFVGDDDDDEVDCLGETFTTESPFDSLPLPECFSTNFHLWRPTISQKAYISENYIPSSFDKSKKTIFLVHGLNDEFGSVWGDLRVALLAEDDVNVIETEWKKGADQNILLGDYKNAASNTRVAARALYRMWKALKLNGLSWTNIHCIGHSLGAHVCGLAGQYEDQKIGRISGLDPAGPEFEELRDNARLSRDDASFVDVLHTNGGGNDYFDYGSLIQMGHLDFYANGGKDQPGCFNKKREQLTEKEKRMEELDKKWRELEQLVRQRTKRGSKRGSVIKGLHCSHSRALPLYTETVNSQNCVANKVYGQATVESLYVCGGCSNPQPVAGYHSIDYKSNPGMYGFDTRSSSPYC